MSDPIRRRLRHGALGAVLVVAATSFLLGIRWGLPSRAADAYLFGDQPPWPGATIVRLAPPESDDRGADVDANPIVSRDAAVPLNQNDAQRGEIVRRYRLFSYQPDEMITFKSLSRIVANRGDPRLYQYGGLWVYPVGALLKLASVVGYVDLRSDQAYYLDHPEAFARFYVIARLYAACWGIVGAWAIFWIVRRISGGLLLPTAAGFCFGLMPVVINMAHEAKPHLPGAVLVLLTVMAAARYAETGATRWVAAAGAACGAASGMILVGAIAFAVLAVMALLRHDAMRRRLIVLGVAANVALAVYVVTNPFVIINGLARPERLRSNVGNTTAMYPTSAGGVANAGWLVVEGASPVVAGLGVAGGFVLIIMAIRRKLGRACGDACPGRGDVGWLIAAPAVLIAFPFVAFAADKPAEYARFALVLDLALLVAAFAGIGRIRSSRGRALLSIVLVATTAAAGWPYVRGFLNDSHPLTSRLRAAEELKRRISGGERTVTLLAEPAPYACPPIDLFRCQLLLAPAKAAPAEPVAGGLSVRPDPARRGNPISWANVRFAVADDSPTRPPAAATLSSP